MIKKQNLGIHFGTIANSKSFDQAYDHYWDVSAGTVVDSQGYAYVDPSYGGGASQSSSQRNRFFKTSVRFYDGFKIDANSNWQE